MPEIVRSNPLNDAGSKPVKTHSQFRPDYSMYATHRFGLNTPHFVMSGVAGDDISARAAADFDTFSLKAPLMMPIKRSMDYFQIPLRAILPNSAELLITNPLSGDDVIAENVNAILKGSRFATFTNTFINRIQNGFSRSFDPTVSGSSGILSALNELLYAYQVCKLFYLRSSLPKYLGYGFDTLTRLGVIINDSDGNHVDTVDRSLDWFFEKCFQGLSLLLEKLPNDLPMTKVSLSISAAGSSTTAPTCTPVTELCYLAKSSVFELVGVVGTRGRFSLRSLLDAIEEGNEFFFLRYNDAFDDRALDSLMPGSTIVDRLFTLADGELGYSYDIEGFNVSSTLKHVNLLRVLAYQVACAEFYTNDKVDGVYSAKLYHDNLKTLYLCCGNTLPVRYELNDVLVDYDACAGECVTRVIQDFTNITVQLSQLQLPINITSSNVRSLGLTYWAYLHNIFSFTRSLKFEDYLVGSRVRPLAVGNVDVQVNSDDSNVSVIDITRNIQVQRFLNQVNRVGRKFTDYVKGVLGDKPMKDVHEPIFLGHITDTFGAEETDNTGEAQLKRPNSTTSKLRNNSQRYGFDVHIGEPSIVIGITNYDIPRVYDGVTDRDNFHVDRYDMFNPFMQFTGDQEVFGSEISLSRTRVDIDSIFSYQTRYAEYRQRLNVCAGGFAEGVLPGYAKIIPALSIPYTINSDFLRAHVNELDEFYVSLSGFIPSYRFNFIIRYDNGVSAGRPMAFNPSIL